MHTETLSVGSELTAGSTIDTNAAWISKQLARHGLLVSRHTILPDQMELLIDFLADLKLRSQSMPILLLISGGLGPTLDDMTRDAVAGALGVETREYAECRQFIEELFRRRNWPMAASNLRQAMLPVGSEALSNDRGTAPGFYIRQNNLHVFSMPGVPNEMKAMFAAQVEPRLKAIVPPGAVVMERTLHTFGEGESSVGQKIESFMAEGLNPSVGTTVACGMVSIRLRARGDSAGQAHELLETTSRKIIDAVGDIYVGSDEETLPVVVGRLLTERGETLAVAESCTGGLLSKLLTDMPGATSYFMEGVVTYANAAKISRLGVPADLLSAHGAVSEPVARAMAEGLRRQAQTTYALSITGIAGPGGGSAEKPVGLVYVALACPGGATEVIKPRMPGDREHIRMRSALAALNLLRLKIRNNRPV